MESLSGRNLALFEGIHQQSIRENLKWVIGDMLID